MIARSHSGFMLRYNVFISKMHLERRFAQKKTVHQILSKLKVRFAGISKGTITQFDSNCFIDAHFGGGERKKIPSDGQFNYPPNNSC